MILFLDWQMYVVKVGYHTVYIDRSISDCKSSRALAMSFFDNKVYHLRVCFLITNRTFKVLLSVTYKVYVVETGKNNGNRKW